MLQASIHYTAAWGVGVTALAGISAVVLTNYLNGRREDQRSAAARTVAQEQLQREDRRRQEEGQREDRLRFLQQRRDLYVRTMVAVNALSHWIDKVNAEAKTLATLAEHPELDGEPEVGFDTEEDLCDGLYSNAEDVLRELYERLMEVLAEVELLAPTEVRQAGRQLEIAARPVKPELGRLLLALNREGDDRSKALESISWGSIALELAQKMSIFREVAQHDLGLQ